MIELKLLKASHSRQHDGHDGDKQVDKFYKFASGVLGSRFATQVWSGSGLDRTGPDWAGLARTGDLVPSFKCVRERKLEPQNAAE